MKVLRQNCWLLLLNIALVRTAICVSLSAGHLKRWTQRAGIVSKKRVPFFLAESVPPIPGMWFRTKINNIHLPSGARRSLQRRWCLHNRAMNAARTCFQRSPIGCYGQVASPLVELFLARSVRNYLIRSVQLKGCVTTCYSARLGIVVSNLILFHTPENERSRRLKKLR